MGASVWAKRRSGSASDSPPETASPSSSSGASIALSVSDASSDSYEDDKFHLPADHQPFLLLPGWDRTPPPPTPPEAPGGSSSGSDSEEGGSSGGSDSSSGDSSSKSQLPVVPPPPPPGFSCSNCAMFKALGNGTFGCESTDFQRWAGTDKLVETKSGRPVMDPTRACSDWFKPATGPSAQPIPTRHSPK